jgi:hypothetical protein
VDGRKAIRSDKNRHRPWMDAKTFHNKFVDSICHTHHCFLPARFEPRECEVVPITISG